MKVYVDGVLSAEDGSSQRGDLIYPREDYLAMGGGLFTIGAYHDSNEYWPLLGFTDEVRLWNEALPASRIGQNSCRDLVAPLPRTLLGYWKFDEHAGADALNEVAGGSQGVLVVSCTLSPRVDSANDPDRGCCVRRGTFCGLATMY